MIECDPKDIALKSFFLGPQSENADWLRQEITEVLEQWFEWRRQSFPNDGRAVIESDLNSEEFHLCQRGFSDAVKILTKRFEKETPKFTPRYIGHMVSELSLSGILGHIIALLHNPNNASREVANVSQAIEREAIGFLAKMIGYGNEATGHFTSGGTVANFEAMWRARFRLDHWHSLCAYLQVHHKGDQESFVGAHMGWEKYRSLLIKHQVEEDQLKPYSFVVQGPWEYQTRYRQWFGRDFLGPVILVPGSKHYSWQKGTSLMGFGDSAFVSVELDSSGKLCVNDLKNRVEQCLTTNRPILMVVSVAGTTELGDVDPVDEVQDYLDQLRQDQSLHIWHHVDAAYGGFFASLQEDLVSVLGQKVANAFDALKRVDSVTLDPHKLGYVPYSCGAIVVPDTTNNAVSSFKAPYLNNVKEDPQIWSSTIEGSRPGSGAAATWLTGHSLTYTKDGLGRVLQKGIVARDRLRSALSKASDEIRTLPHCDTNVVCFSVGRVGESLTLANQRTEAVFRLIASGREFAVSKTILGVDSHAKLISEHVAQFDGSSDCESLILIRTVLMNPFIISKNTSISYLDEFCRVIAKYISDLE